MSSTTEKRGRGRPRKEKPLEETSTKKRERILEDWNSKELVRDYHHQYYLKRKALGRLPKPKTCKVCGIKYTHATHHKKTRAHVFAREFLSSIWLLVSELSDVREREGKE